MSDSYEHIIKIMLVGDSNVGKTALVNRYCSDTYSDRTTSTIGIQYKDKVIRLNNKKYRIQLWDTAGQEKFRTITPSFYRSAMAIMLVYSVEDRDTFSSVGIWLKQIKKYAPQNLPIVLIANKCDLVRRQVLQKQGRAVAQQHHIDFMECSAKEDIGVGDAIFRLIKNVKLQFQKEEKIILMEKQSQKEKEASLSYCKC